VEAESTAEPPTGTSESANDAAAASFLRQPSEITDQGQVPDRRYARGPEPLEEGEGADGSRIDQSSAGSATYAVSQVDESGFSPDPEAFYDVAYRAKLRRMVAHVITVEGPIFDDLLVRRIARAHGFQRAAGRIRDIVLNSIERRFSRSQEDGRTIYWREGAETTSCAFRRSRSEDRDHSDIPLVELAALAFTFLADGASREEAITLMARTLELGRLREAARERFSQAAKMAQALAVQRGISAD
jgi:hypothetical protein